MVGEILRLRMKGVNKRGKVIYNSTFDGDFHSKTTGVEDVETVHYVVRGGKVKVIPVQEQSYELLNQKSLSEIFKKWEEHFYDFINKNYLKKITININLSDAVLYVDNRPIAYSEKKPIVIFLKPGKYTFTAKLAGRRTVNVTKTLTASEEIPLDFNKEEFHVDIKIAVLGKSKPVIAEIGSMKKKITGAGVMKKVYNSEQSVSVSGLGRKITIPLKIDERKIYSINVMNDFSTTFKDNKENLWQSALASESFEYKFGSGGLALRGSSEGEKWIGNGVITKPFFMDNVEMEFEVEKRKKGEFAFFILNEDNKNVGLIFNGTDVYGVSDYDITVGGGARVGMTQGKRISGNKIIVNVKIENNKIYINEGGGIVYSSPFKAKQSSQIFFAVDAEVPGAKVEYVVKKFRYVAQ
ncbi:hypothetical protein ACFL6D_02415 [Spirochaetota bacterium]